METVLVTKDPVVEVPVEEVAANAQQEYTEDQIALFLFEKHFKLFHDKIVDYNGSKQQLIRAWANAALSPLNKEELHFSYPEEKELFDHFTEANSAKLILMVHGLEKSGVLTLHKPLIERTLKAQENVTPEVAIIDESNVVEETIIVNKE